MTRAPAWRKPIDAVVAPGVRTAVHHDTSAVLLATVVRFRRQVLENAERVSRHALHALNLPTGTDINRLLSQIAAVQREVRELAKKLDSA